MDYTAIRYIAFTKDEKKVLSCNGFKNVEKMSNYNIKLFNTPSSVKDYFESHRLYSKCEIKIKRIKVTYEFLKRGDDDDQ